MLTVHPSTMGSRSRCTPSRETSGPCVPSRPAILSTSSRKTIPEFSTRAIASPVTSSLSTSLSASSCVKIRRASWTLTLRRRVRWGRRFPSISLRFSCISSMPWPPIRSIMGSPRWATSISTVRSSSAPSRSRARNFSRVSWTAPALRRRADGGPRRRQEQVQEPLLRQLPRPLLHGARLLAAHHIDRELHQVADHRLDVATHVPHLGVLGGLHLDERRLGQPSQPPGNLGLADPGRPDHDDVLRGHLVAETGGQPLPAPAVPQGDGHRPLGVVLSDDVFVQLRHDLARGHLVHGRQSSSMVIRSLVYTHSPAAIRMASSTISRAESVECFTRARAAAAA